MVGTVRAGDGAGRACQARDAMYGEDGPYSVISEFVLRMLSETDQCIFEDGRALRNLCRGV